MSDIEKPSSPNASDTGIKQEDEELESSQDFSSSQISQNDTGLLKVNDEPPAEINGSVNGHHELNGHISDEEEEFEIDIDPRMDMMMLEPQVDIIEDPNEIPPPLPSHEPSIFRRKRAKPHSSKGHHGSPKPKRRLVADDTDNVDDRVGCRSLVCDSNGIIIAEMVFRCMICAHVSDAISTARQHYQAIHMSRQPFNNSSSSRNGAFNRPSAQNYDTDDDDEQDEFDNDLEIEACRSRHNFHEFTNHNVQNEVPSNSRNLGNNFSTFSSEDFLDAASMDLSALKKPGNFVTAPTPMSYVPESILGSNLSPSTPTTRGGYVTCAVCNITKYYASVQRRYGQFTCMGCAKFFGRFLLKPKRYFCPNLETSPRCKACLLVACINTYVIDEKRMKVVNANRPVKKSASNSPRTQTSQASSQSSHVSPVPQRPQVTNPNNFVKRNLQTSMNFAPPPLVKAPITVKLESKTSLLSADQHPTSNESLRAKRPNLSSLVSRPNGSVGGRKGTGCRQCANCLADDCGSCNYCKDKPKFGGPNTLKKKCLQKKCLLLQTGGFPRAKVANK